MAKWITFVERDPDPKKVTREWSVKALSNGAHLGEVRWYSPWRKYAFYTYTGALFEADCLMDIAQFLTNATSTQRLDAKIRREARHG